VIQPRYAVTGDTAQNYDDTRQVHDSTPAVFALVAVLAFVVLMAAFRSIAVAFPRKRFVHVFTSRFRRTRLRARDRPTSPTEVSPRAWAWLSGMTPAYPDDAAIARAVTPTIEDR